MTSSTTTSSMWASCFGASSLLTITIAVIIGVHVGPAVGIAYECKQRIEGKFTATTPEAVM